MLCAHCLGEAGQVFMLGSWNPHQTLEPDCRDTPSLLTPLRTLLVTSPLGSGRQEQKEGCGETPKETWSSILCKGTHWCCAERAVRRLGSQPGGQQPGRLRAWSWEAGSGLPGGGVDRMLLELLEQGPWLCQPKGHGSVSHLLNGPVK